MTNKILKSLSSMRRYAAVLLLLLTSVSQTWAEYNYNWYGNVFFRAPDDWDLSTYSHVQIGLARTTSTSTSSYTWFFAEMDRVGTTRLFYKYVGADHSSWGQNEYVFFTANSSNKSAGDRKVNSLSCYTTPKGYGFCNNDNPYLFNPSTEVNGAAVDASYSSTGSDYAARRDNLLKKTQRANIYTNGSSSKTGGSVRIDGYYLTSNTAASTSYVTNGSNTYASYDAAIGTPVTLTATANTGYQFDGWYDAGTGGSLVSNSNPYSYTCKTAKTVYARFSVRTFTITLHDNNGGSNNGSATATYNSTSLTSITAPTRTNYHVLGYYEEAECTHKVATDLGALQANTSYTNANSKWTSTSNQTLYAKWEPDSWSITYKDQGNVAYSGSNSASLPSSYTYGEGVALVDGIKSNYQFDGWFDNQSCTGTAITSISTTATGAKTFYAKWTENPGGTVTLSAGTGGQVSKNGTSWSSSASYTGIKTTDALNIYAQANSGYTFNTWSITSGSGTITTNAATGVYTPVANADATLTASFTETLRTITISGGTTASTTAGVVTTGSATAAAPAEGKKFTGWSLGDGVTLSGCAITDRTITFNASADATVTAQYADRAQVKMYFVKPDASWSKVYAYAWQGSNTSNKNKAYPGVELSTTETINCVTYHVYQYYTEGDGIGGAATGQSTWNKIIFGDNNDARKTADLTIANGHFYHKADNTGENGRPAATVSGSASGHDWYVCGYWNQSTNKWGFDYPIPIDCSSKTGNVVIDVTASRTQQFKIYQASKDKWFKYTGGPSAAYDANYDITSMIGQSLTMREYNLNRNTFTSSTNSYRFTLDVTNTNNPILVVAPGTDNDYSATLSINSFGHGSVSPEAGAITLHRYTPTSITATPEAGYRFKQWNISGCSLAAGSTSTSNPASFTATADGGTIEAEFTQDGIIYFDNTMSQWKGDIYVYFFNNNAWYDNAKDGKGPGMVPAVNYDGGGKMTRIGNTNYYYYNYHADGITPTRYIGFTKGDQRTYKAVYQTSAAYRSDFDACLPMYIASQTWSTTNETGYHNAGYWKRYNVTESGFTISGLNVDWSTHTAFTSATPNSNTFKAKVHLNNQTHSFKIFRCAGEALGNNGKMTPASHSGWEMTPGTNNCQIEAPTGDNYEFTLSLGTDHIYLSVEYPLLQYDYRLLYKGRITTDGADVHYHPSQSIRHLTGNNKTQKDTVSFFVDKDHKGTIYLQYCTNPASYGGKGAWSNVTSGGNPVTVSLSGVSETGVYSFVITQTTNGSGTRTVTAAPLAEGFKYSGPLYIRTDASDGGWEAYKNVDNNQLEYSEWAKDHSGYDYYHCYFAATNTNVHFTIANKYSPSISDTCTNDAIVTDGRLHYQANVRFMYNSATNKISRAYLNGSAESGENEFLVLQGADSRPQIFDKNGGALPSNHTKLDDNGNWIYSIDIKAEETARVKLISNYRFDNTDHKQYFIGTSAAWSPASTEQILGGNDPTSSHTIRVIYDFKTNHLISAWLADGNDVSTPKAINTSIMIVREHQEDAKQITFTGTGKLTEVGTVYGVMKFNKWTINNKNKTGAHAALSPTLSPYERGLYWISFPFNVKLNDVFGFGEYGTHWIIEYYDGKGRAANGFWAESSVNWKYVYPYMKDNYTLKANEGYILALDLDELTESSHVWDYVEDVYLYFPSESEVSSIVENSVSVDITQTGYECTINRTVDASGNPTGLSAEYDRRIRDSYWHCIGVPSFANNANTVKHDGWEHGTTWDYPDVDPENWSAASLPFYYAWNKSNNALAPYSTGSRVTFKAMNAYLVQYSQTSLSWTNVTTPQASSVAKRRMKAEDISFAEFKLDLMKGEEELDHTYVLLTDDEEVTSGFEFGHDLTKAFNAGANIYTIVEQVEVAGNSLPLEYEKTTIVPLGVKIVADGEYTFSMPEGTNGVGVTLVDNETGTRTNLGLTDYAVTLPAGDHNNRFVLEISPIVQVTTSVEQINGENGDAALNGVCKKLIDGVLYIVKDGKVFDARGARLQ